MPESPFITPSLSSMNSLLPAFDFSEIMTSSNLGAVYFAIQRSLDRQVAIKVFAPVLGSDKRFSDSFEIAAKSAAALRHPNLIGFIDSGVIEGMPFIVMEFVPGKSLARSTKGMAIDFEQSMRIIEGVCEGIAYAHENHVVHGNLDTLNILLNQRAEPKIGNFGLSRSVHTGSEVEIFNHFSAPEVLANSSPPTKASDVYSVAAIFYELITGRPYSADAPQASSLTKCSKEIDKIIRQATDPDPTRRMNDVRVFYSALKATASPVAQISLAAAKEKTSSNDRAKVATSSAPKFTDTEPHMNKRASTTKVGFDSNLLLKLIVIALLAFAVHQTWNYLKESRAERDRENRQIIADKKEAQEKALAEYNEKRAREIAERKEAEANAAAAVPVIPQKVETPEESLERLRVKLQSGLRSEMPIGTIRKGDSDFFLVTKPMTWGEALLFAENHGAFLAIPNTDLSWLPAELTKDRTFWIGAGRSVNDAWTLVDGSNWVPDRAISGSDQFVVMEASGSFSTGDATANHLFVMQWKTDGSNPATLGSQLKTTRDSLSGSSPVFPPGTVSFDNRHFLKVSRPVSWNDANQLAESAGGNLMVVSDEEEAAQLEKMTGRLNPQDMIWLGAFLKNDLWSWVTGEPWQDAKWIAGANATENGAAMILRPGRGWDGLAADKKASGFIIEWSSDKTKSHETVEPTAPGNEGEELVGKAKSLIEAADQKREDALAANIKKLKWDLDAHIRGLKKSDNELWAPYAEQIKECVDGNRLQPQEIRDQGISMSEFMAKLVEYHSGKQNEIDEQFIKDAGSIRDIFVVKMAEIRDKANAAGQIKLVTDASQSIERARDLKAWVESNGLVYKPQERERFEPEERTRPRRSFSE